MTSHGDLKTMDRNAMLTPTTFLSMQEDFHQEDGHSSDLDQKRSGILLMAADHKENAQAKLRQKYQERVERLSQQNRVIKICIDAGFLTTVGVGQYFMIKDTEEFSQFTEPATCREHTLPRDEKSSDSKRLDSREYQNWARVRSHNHQPAR